MEILLLIGVVILVLGIIGLILQAIAAVFKFIFEIICGICELIVELVTEHLELVLGILGTAITIALLCLYIRKAEEPFAFIPKAWNFVMQGHNISGIVLGSILILFLCILVTKIGGHIVENYRKKINIVVILAFTVWAIVKHTSLGLIVNYFVCFVLYEGYKKGLRTIFGKEDISHTVPKKYICFSWNYVSIWYVVTVLKFPVEVWNRHYNTTIQADKLTFVMVMLVNLLLCISMIIVLKGFISVRHTVKKIGIFDYFEILDKYQEKYNNDYVQSILDNMKNFLVKSQINENEWMTKKYMLFWKKNIQQGKRMGEIESGYQYALHNQTFRELYIKMYDLFQGVCLEFPTVHDEEDIYHKKDAMFRMFRYKIVEHPVLQEKNKIRNRYLLQMNYYIRQFYRKYSENSEILEPEYMQLRWLEGLCRTKAQREQLKTMINKQNYLDKSLKHGKKDYAFLLILEVLYWVKSYIQSADADFQFEEIEELAEEMGVSQQKNIFLYRFFIYGIYNFQRDKLKEINQDYKTQFQDELMDYFVKQLIENKEYEEREETHVAICATVSSGKSTFLNTILEKNLMPNRMTACTARMSVIRTNDSLEKPISVIEGSNTGCEYEYDISPEKMDEVNKDEKVKRVLTEISVPLLQNASKILYFHDSPGVNNSMNETHHEVTINYLKMEKPEWILFLIDAQQDTVNDNITLLKEVAEHIEKKSNVIFIYNKVDCLKEDDGDDLDENLDEVREMIRQQGFPAPRIFPISAKAAQLFSEVLADRQKNFTKEDERLFRECFRFFKKKQNNMQRYFEEEVSAVRNKEYENLDRENIVVIKDNEYKKGDILEAWYRTGVYALVEWILQYIAGKEEKL